MTKEISLFRDQKNVTPIVGGPLDETTKRLLGGSNYKRISIRGKKFRMIVNGQEAAKAPGTALEVVVVNAAPAVSRHYYSKAYDPNAKELPDCWSNDGIRPDPRAVAPQGKTCELCPKNRQGSGTNGSRACKFSRRLAVVLGNDVANSDVYQMQLSATSLFGKGTDGNMPLDAYVKQLAGYNYSITQVVTEMSFDDDSDAPKIYFRAVRQLELDEREIVAAKGASQEAQDAVTFNPAQMDNPKARPAPTPAPVPPEPALFKQPPAEVKAAPAEKPAEESTEEPTVRQSKSKPVEPVESENFDNLLDDWSDDD